MSLVVLRLRIQRFDAKPEVGVQRYLSIEDPLRVLVGQEVLLGHRHCVYDKLLVFLVEYMKVVFDKVEEDKDKVLDALEEGIALRGYDSRYKKS